MFPRRYSQRCGSCLLLCLVVAAGCQKKPAVGLPKVQCRMMYGSDETQPMYQWKYQRVRKKIVEVMQENGGEMEFKQLRKDVKRRFSEQEREEIGSPLWLFETVALEMEVQGELKRQSESTSRFPAHVTLRLDE